MLNRTIVKGHLEGWHCNTKVCLVSGPVEMSLLKMGDSKMLNNFQEF